MSRDYGKVLPQFWTGETGKALRKRGIETQFVALYLLTCPNANMIGLYYLPLPTLCHETGLNLEGALKGLQRASEEGFCLYDAVREEVWVPQMARIQIGASLKAGDNQIKGVERLAESFQKSRFFKDFVALYADSYHLSADLREQAKASPFEGPPKPLRSQEQEQEQEEEQEHEQEQPSGRAAADAVAAPGQSAFGLANQEPPRPKKATAPEVAEAITFFQRRWVELRNPTDGKRPTMTDADKGQLVRLLKAHGLEPLKAFLERYLVDEDQFLVANGHALKHLPSRLDGYRSAARPKANGARGHSRPAPANTETKLREF